MNLLTRLGLHAYRALARTGILQTRWGHRAFISAYMLYKRVAEADHIEAALRHVAQDSLVIDVGANIGFYSRVFARRAKLVLAVEPEPGNYAELQAQTRSLPVEAIQAVLAEQAGELWLKLDPNNPANHKINAASTEGVRVPAYTLDGLMAGREGRVSFIKIDVQGAEMRVLGGAQVTIAHHQPAIQIELDEAALNEFGTSVQAVLRHMRGLGYAPYSLHTEPLDDVAVQARVQAAGYEDVLFLPQGTP